MKELSVYVHVPFCKSKCKYCDFNSYVGCENLISRYFSCLYKEIKNFGPKFKDYTVTTIYIGGGTPSYVDEKLIANTLKLIKKEFNVAKNSEISMEANPNSITLEKAQIWKGAGINRISVGMQSANNKLLKLIGRIHTLRDYKKAMEFLKLAGFNNINTDIMIGLPKQSLGDMLKAIKVATKHSTHVSAYSLIVEEGTPLKSLIEKKELSLPKEELAIEMYDMAVDKLKKAGFDRYEVSNFAKKGYECKHNLNCWDYLPYIGFGAGAHSFIDNRRCENVHDINVYICKIKESGDPTNNSQMLTKNEQIEEYIMVGMRKTDGIYPKKIKEKFGYNILKAKDKEIEQLQKAGFIEVKNSIYATEMGFFVLNRIILELI